uniref:26S proteasome non-ATPase regulatory subunit 4 n=1 Tax=Steinernema glaseri TaxID=37863 RepID=A0A1I7ZL13_9BILA
MVQESTMICIDNSDYMRNGDFAPTRMQSQQEAANLILQCKLRNNPENAVGLITMADTVQVLSTMTQEDRKLFAKLHQVEINGTCKFISAIKIAHLALKHRQNRNHRMRIVMFWGSPLPEMKDIDMYRLAKKLKKEKVFVDLILFGEANCDGSMILDQFVDCINGQNPANGSNILQVATGTKLTDAIIKSPICRGEDGQNVAVASSGGGYEFGVDGEDDPDLALALRVSLEEQRQHDPDLALALRVSLEEQRQRQMAEAGANGAAATEGDVVMAEADAAPAADLANLDPEAMTEEQQLEWALRMSLQDTAQAEPQSSQGAADQPEAMETEHEMELANDPELLRQIVEEISASDAKEGQSNAKSGSEAAKKDDDKKE